MIHAFLRLGLVSAVIVVVSACAQPEQSAECARYLACVRAIDAQEAVTTDAKRFEADGACWGGPEGAALCTRACAGGLSYLQKAYSDLPEACR